MSKLQRSIEIERSSFADRLGSGGGEGIRTPDPRVANAVLCQLSYTPDNEFRTANFGYGLKIRNVHSAIAKVGCGGGI